MFPLVVERLEDAIEVASVLTDVQQIGFPGVRIGHEATISALHMLTLLWLLQCFPFLFGMDRRSLKRMIFIGY